ncbi:MAG: hypothetical protein D6736_12275 [Nitrospinota bacterium]|nr:MAG: hypothetical protein D6736_12275 [Nitrospinota bacterium]
MTQWRRIVSILGFAVGVVMLIFFPLAVLVVGTLTASLALLAYQNGWLREDISSRDYRTAEQPTEYEEGITYRLQKPAA